MKYVFYKFSFLKHSIQDLFFILVLFFLFALPQVPYLSLGIRGICITVSCVLIYFILKKINLISFDFNSTSFENKKVKKTKKKVIKNVLFLFFFLCLPTVVNAKDPTVADTHCVAPAKLLRTANDGCWICKINETILKKIGKLSSFVDQDMRNMALDLLLIIFLFWIVIKVLSLFFNIFSGGVTDFTSDFVRRTALVTISAVLLLSPLTDFFGFVITPFAQIASGFTEKIIDEANSRPTDDTTIIERITGTSPDTQSYTKTLKCCYCTNSCGGKDPVGLLDRKTLNALLCMTCISYKQVTPLIVAGQVITCYGWSEEKFFEWIVGVGLFITFVWVTIAVAIYELDVFFKLAVVFIFMPFFIATYPFPSTRSYTKKAFDLLIFCFLKFLGLGIILAVLSGLLLTMFPQEEGLGTMLDLVDVLKKGTTQQVYSFFAMGKNGVPVLRTLLICLAIAVIVQKLIKSTENLMTNLTGMFVPPSRAGGEGLMEAFNVSTAIGKFGATVVKNSPAAVVYLGKFGINATKKTIGFFFRTPEKYNPSTNASSSSTTQPSAGNVAQTDTSGLSPAATSSEQIPYLDPQGK